MAVVPFTPREETLTEQYRLRVQALGWHTHITAQRPTDTARYTLTLAEDSRFPVVNHLYRKGEYKGISVPFEELTKEILTAFFDKDSVVEVGMASGDVHIRQL